MVLTRGALFLLAVLSSSGALWAQVELTIRADGKKVIYNVSSSRSNRGYSLSWLAKQRNRASVYDGLIKQHAQSFGVDPVLAKAVIQVESNYNPACVSHKGARGLMQLMPGTARRFNVERVHDPEQNIRGGIQYLSVLLKLFGNDLPRTLAAYNAGENAVLRYGGIPPYEETKTYVQRALTVYYGRPHGGGAVSYSGGGHRKLAGGFGAAPAPKKLAVVAASAAPAIRKASLQSFALR